MSYLQSIASFLAGIALMYMAANMIIIPLEVEKARSGYVLQTVADAAIAQKEELQRQLKASEIVIASYQEIAKNDQINDEQIAASTETRIANYEALLRAQGRACDVTQSDIDQLQ